MLHVGRVTYGSLHTGDEAELAIDSHRRAGIRAHHTATHLLNHALRAVAGPDSDQRGSLVSPDRLRFDYAASGALDADALAEVERQVTESIAAAHTVHAVPSPLEQAQAVNTLRAVFGERYPDPVRVVSIGPEVGELLASPEDPRWMHHSVEFCGGTHLSRTDEADDFVLLSEQGLAAGVRRIVGLAGEAAAAARALATELEQRIAALETSDQNGVLEAFDDLAREFEIAAISVVDKARLATRVDGLRAIAKKARKAAAAANRGAVVDDARAIAESQSGPVIVALLDGADKEGLLSAMDAIRSVHPDAAVLLLSADEDAGSVLIVAKVPEDLIKAGLKAGDWVKAAAKACGGGGGGRPDSAQAGGKDPSRADEAVEAAKAHAAAAAGA